MLDKLKLMLDFTDEDEKRDERLRHILDNTTARLLVLLGGEKTVPEELSYIVQEVAIIRFNRIGSEGLSSHTVEGESLTFKDNDFDAFKSDIQAWLDKKNSDASAKGGFRFL